MKPRRSEEEAMLKRMRQIASEATEREGDISGGLKKPRNTLSRTALNTP
jgi:hypothetical protein